MYRTQPTVTRSRISRNVHSFVILYVVFQKTRPTFWPTSRDWSLILRTSLNLISGCWITFSAWMCWLADSLPRFAVKERCMNETTPCWICWRRKTSVTSLWKPYNKLANSTWPISSHKMEVNNTAIMSLRVPYHSNVTQCDQQTLIQQIFFRSVRQFFVRRPSSVAYWRDVIPPNV